MANVLEDLVNCENFVLNFCHPFLQLKISSTNLLGTVCVITNDGRNIVGRLRGYDRATNVILEDCHERVFSVEEAVEQIVLGLYVIRGDNMFRMQRQR